MPQPLNLLLLEDNADDAELVLRALRQSGFVLECQRVESEAVYVARLSPGLDLIISDFSMPQFDGLHALKLLKQSGLEIPFILVSGTIGEEAAVQAMKQGAADYVMKDRLARLGQAVTHALDQQRLRRERRDADEALRVADAHLAELLAQSPAVLYDLRLDDGRPVPRLVSENVATLLGFSVTEALGRDWWSGQLHPEDRARALQSVTETLESGTSRVEYRLRHKDGHYCWVDDVRRLVRDADGRPDRLIGIWSDVTERKRAEEIVRQASGHVVRNRRRRVGIELAILAGATAVIFVCAARFEWFEAASKWIMSHDATQVDDLVITAIFFSVGLMVFAVRRWRETEIELTGREQTQTALGILHQELEQRVRQRTEELGNTNRALRAEIAERQQTVEALRGSEARFRQVVETIREVFWMRDVERDRIIYVSPGYERIWGRASETLSESAQSWIGSIVPEDRARVVRAASAGAAGGDYDETYRIARPDGAVRWIRDRAFPVKEADGRVRRIVGVAEDVTERKKLEEQFLHAQRMEAIGTLASGVAHDLNNILSPMLMVAGLLKETAVTAKDREMLAMIEQSGQRGAGIIRQLLTFGRGISGERVTVQMKHLMKEMAGIMRETFPRNIEIVEAVPNDLWTVEADPTQLHQVILNLCVNARDAMPGGGTLTLNAANAVVDGKALVPDLPPGAYLVFTVTDTGHGIPAEIAGRIFDPFFTTKEIGKGTGLGLSTVVGIVKSHGGVVKVLSEPGKGTEFRIHLPASVGSESAAKTATTAPLPHGREELILVVDDEEPVCDAARSLLERSGYRVLVANSGEPALKLFIQHQGTVRLLVTDLMMPGLDGLDLIRAVRILEPTLRVVVSTGLDGQQHRKELAALGVNEVLTKPCLPNQMLKAVNAALAR